MRTRARARSPPDARQLPAAAVQTRLRNRVGVAEIHRPIFVSCATGPRRCGFYAGAARVLRNLRQPAPTIVDAARRPATIGCRLASTRWSTCRKRQKAEVARGSRLVGVGLPHCSEARRRGPRPRWCRLDNPAGPAGRWLGEGVALLIADDLNAWAPMRSRVTSACGRSIALQVRRGLDPRHPRSRWATVGATTGDHRHRELEPRSTGDPHASDRLDTGRQPRVRGARPARRPARHRDRAAGGARTLNCHPADGVPPRCGVRAVCQGPQAETPPSTDRLSRRRCRCARIDRARLALGCARRRKGE